MLRYISTACAQIGYRTALHISFNEGINMDVTVTNLIQLQHEQYKHIFTFDIITKYISQKQNNYATGFVSK